MDLTDLISGHSKALYSTWMLYRPDHLLIDCGEGAATTLGNAGFFIEKVLLTHGHSDHITGLPTLLWSRAAGMGDNEKPLHIFYPRGDGFVEEMRAYLQRGLSKVPYELTWTPLDAGDSIALSAGAGSRHERVIESFATRHGGNRLTLGYKILETRRRLKPEFAALSQAEIALIARDKGREEVANMTEEFRAIIAAWSGDTMPLDPNIVRGAELLAHEATLLDASERQQPTHSTLDEAIGVAKEAAVKTLLLHHVSGRYRTGQIREAIERSARRHGVSFPIWCLFRDRLWHAWPHEEKRDDAATLHPAPHSAGKKRILLARSETRPVENQRARGEGKRNAESARVVQSGDEENSSAGENQP